MPGKEEPLESSGADFVSYSETIDELFDTTFTHIRDSSTNAMGKICELIGRLTDLMFISRNCSCQTPPPFLIENINDLSAGFNPRVENGVLGS